MPARRPDITIAQTVEAYRTHGTIRAAARALGLDHATVCRRLKANHVTTHAPPPDGHLVKGVSTLYDAKGKVRAQWVKTRLEDEERSKSLIEAVRAAFEDAEPIPTIPAPEFALDELLVAYPMGDPHIGMYAWAAETGADFDLDIAERNLTNAMARLVSSAPAAETGLIVNVGDFFHADSSENRTLRSGNALDVDTRWQKILEVGIRAMRTCIESALAKHPKVKVIIEAGNHDDHTAVMLRLALSLYYERNPRVEFDTSPAKFHYHQHGKTLIGVTHGDTVKPEALGGIMSVDCAAVWSETAYRYWISGHVHHKRVIELAGCIAETFRTLAPRDAWAHGAGYRAGQDMSAIVYSREWGEIERHRVDIRMLA